MRVFDRISGDDYEQVVFCHDRATGLRAIVVIHSTRLGPALGGTRFYPYDDEDQALEDVIRLARAMTYKAAAAGLDLGGGKAVILGDPHIVKNEQLLASYGRFVEALGGRYVTAEDVGTNQDDMDVIRRETRFVAGTSPEHGGSGDPSLATAEGLVWAMKAVAHHLWSDISLKGRHVAVAGVGKVGRSLVGRLVAEQAQVTIADVDAGVVNALVEQFGVARAPVDKIHTVDCDIYAPCALGGALNRATIGELGCRAVVGSANNQLADLGCADTLQDAGVLYAPDYIVNAGGLIAIAEQWAPQAQGETASGSAVRRIFDTTIEVLADADAGRLTPAVAADRRARARLDRAASVESIRTFG